jgi:TolB-like protein
VKLQEKPFQILAALVECPGEVVTRQELRERLWPADTFVDFDHSLKTAVSKVREALGDSAEHPRFIETLARRGYRFIAPVETAGPLPPGGRSQGGRIMLAVLPFENLSGDPTEDYFSDGMTEEMIAQLGSLCPTRLGVIARTSSMKYKRSGKGIDQIGRELNVHYVLEGSVRRAGTRVRITAQLVQVCDQAQLWGASYERDLGDILKLQSQVAQAIAQEIRVKLPADEEIRLAGTRLIRPEAYVSYLKGRHTVTPVP